MIAMLQWGFNDLIKLFALIRESTAQTFLNKFLKQIDNLMFQFVNYNEINNKDRFFKCNIMNIENNKHRTLIGW